MIQNLGQHDQGLVVHEAERKGKVGRVGGAVPGSAVDQSSEPGGFGHGFCEAQPSPGAAEPFVEEDGEWGSCLEMGRSSRPPSGGLRR
jgi:hypothetical protein